jgi:hypothetical protein
VAKLLQEIELYELLLPLRLGFGYFQLKKVDVFEPNINKRQKKKFM